MNPSPRPALSANLDILRSMAVLFVLADHSTKYMGRDHVLGLDINYLGGLGVLWFFVHTSLVLMQSLNREWNDRASLQSSSWRRVVSFYVRRAWRIYPLSIVVILLVLIVGMPVQRINVIPGQVGTMTPFIPTTKDVLSNLALTQDFSRSPNVIGVLWSLPLELRMYVVLPGLYLLWRRASSPLVMLTLWAGATAWIVFGLPASKFGIISYTPCFLAGVAAFTIAQKEPNRLLPAWSWIPFLITLAVVTLLSPNGLATRAIGCLALGLLIPYVGEVRTRWLALPAAEIARYSYGIYLLHVPVLWLTVGHLRDAPRVVQILAELSTLAIATYLAHWFIEDPGISLGKRLAKRLLQGHRAGSSPSNALAATASSPVL